MKEFAAAFPAIGQLVEELDRQGFAPDVIADALISAGITLGSEAVGFQRTAMILSRLADNCSEHALVIGENGPRH